MSKVIGSSHKKSISKKILLILVGMVLLITILIGTTSIVEHRKEVIALKTEQATTVGNVVAAYADGDQLSQLEKSDSETPYYAEIKATLSNIKTATKVKYLYAVVPDPSKQQIRYLVEGETPDDNPDDIYEFNTIVDYSNFFSDAAEGKAFETAFSNGEFFDNGMYMDPDFGYLMTVFVPIFDSKGSTVAMIGVDMSADDIINQANQMMYLSDCYRGNRYFSNDHRFKIYHQKSHHKAFKEYCSRF